MTIKEKIMKIMSLALEINPPEINSAYDKKPIMSVEWTPLGSRLQGGIFFRSDGCGLSMTRNFYVHVNMRGSDDKLDRIIAELEQIKAELPGGEENADEI